MPSPDSPLLVGVVHLLPLPGAPTPSPGARQVIDRALADAHTLVAGGISAVVIENFGDAPFPAGRARPHVPAFLAAIGTRVRAEVGDGVQIGMNVLRNDALAALGAAAAAGADFIRVNVLSGAAWTDQGLVQPAAHDALLYRRLLGLAPGQPGGDARPVRILGDVLVKHAVPAGDADLLRCARDTARRGGADALILTGHGTGMATQLDDVRAVKAALPDVPVWVGSGVTVHTAADTARAADGAIVGTALHQDGDTRAPLELDRVRRMVDAFAMGSRSA